MKTIKINGNQRFIVLLLAAIICIVFTSSAMASDLIVVATKTTQQASQHWFTFLKSKEVPLRVFTPQEFAGHEKENYIVIIGGINEPRGIKDLLKKVLTKNEIRWISQEGYGKMYVKSDVWTRGQTVIVIAGSNFKAAEEARKASKDEWFDMFADWFDLEREEGGLPAY